MGHGVSRTILFKAVALAKLMFADLAPVVARAMGWFFNEVEKPRLHGCGFFCVASARYWLLYPLHILGKETKKRLRDGLPL